MATTTTRKKTYNPYDDVKAISEYKGKYADAKSTGGDYKQWQQKAAENYMNLHANGRADLADQLAASNYEQSLEILKGYQPTTLYDDYYAKVYGDSVEEASSPKLSEGAQKIFDAYYGVNGILNDKTITKDENGNVVSGLNVDHYNTGRNQLDFINGFDVTKQPYYEGIMQQYNLLGGDAAQGALAGGASGNSGNIDSYARANANRQQLAFTTAGINAALAAANQNQANWQNVYDRMTAHLDSMGEQNNDMLEQANKIYTTDSDERQKIVEKNAELAKEEMLNKYNKYLADIGYDLDVYKTDSEERKHQATENAGLSEAQIKANAEQEAARIQAEAEKYGHDRDYEAKTTATNKQTEANNTGAEIVSLVDEIARHFKNGTQSEFIDSWDGLWKALVAEYGIDEGKKWYEELESTYPYLFNKAYYYDGDRKAVHPDAIKRAESR